MAAKGRTQKPRANIARGLGWIPEWVLRSALPLVLTLATAILVGVARSSEVARATAHLDPGIVRVDQCPDWIDGDVIAEIRAELDLIEPLCLTDTEVVAGRISELKSRVVWVRSVESVSAMRPNALRVALDLRRPIALVPTSRGDVAFDRDGFALPPSANRLRLPNGHGLPRITGGRTALEAIAGTMTPYSEILEGLSVADDLSTRLLGPGASPLHLAEIDVAGIPTSGRKQNPPARGNSEICLVVEGDGGLLEIRWGRSRRSPRARPHELGLEEKLANLTQVLRRPGGIDGVGIVNVWLTDPSTIDR